MTKPFPFNRLSACVLVGLLGTWLLIWQPFSKSAPASQEYVLKLTAISESATTPQFTYFDEHDLPLEVKKGNPKAGAPPTTTTGPFYSFVPSGSIKRVSVSVAETHRIAIKGAAIQSTKGTIIAIIPPSLLCTVDGASARKEREASVLTATQPDEPIVFEFVLDHVIEIPTGNEPGVIEVIGAFLLGAGILWYGASKWEHGLRYPKRFAGFAVKARAHPVLFILAASFVATIANNAPLIFRHRSIVSPNLPFPLLYSTQPYLPNAAQEDLDLTNSADAGAMMWAHMPYSAVEGRAIREDGEFPYWNRYNSCGVPLLGQGQSMMGDPLHLVVVYFRGMWQAWNFKYVAAKFLYASGIGICIWLAFRRMGVAALLSASSLWIGFFAFRYNHAAIYSVCYSPWLLIPWIGMTTAKTSREAAGWASMLIAADWLEFSSGTAKESSMLIFCLNGTGLLIQCLTSSPWKERVQKLGILVAASCVFLLLSAPMWMTFLDALQNSGSVYTSTQPDKLQPGMALALFDGIFAQDFAKHEAHLNPSLNFLILSGVLFLVSGGFAGFKDPVSRGLAITSIPFLALVFGIVPPEWIRHTFALSKIGHIANTFSCVLLTPLTILSASGLIRCIELPRERIWREQWVTSIVFLAAGLSLYLGFTQARTTFSPVQFSLLPISHSRFFAIYGVALVIATTALPWSLRLTSKNGERRFLGFAAAIVCLVAVHFRHGMYQDTAFDTFVMNPRHGSDLAVPSPATRYVHSLTDSDPARVLGLNGTLWPGYNGVLDLECASGPDALFNPFYSELCEASGIEQLWAWRMYVPSEFAQKFKPVTDSLNIRYLFREKNAAPPSEHAFRSLAQLDMDVYESNTAWPRAFYTDGMVEGNSAQDYIAALNAGDGRPFAFGSHETFLPSSKPLSSRTVVSARNYVLTNNTTSFTVSAPGPGVVILLEAYEKRNFRALVNGIEMPYFRINHAFKGVTIEKAGDYHIEFIYRPSVLPFTLILSGIGGALAIGGICFLRSSRQSFLPLTKVTTALKLSTI